MSSYDPSDEEEDDDDDDYDEDEDENVSFAFYSIININFYRWLNNILELPRWLARVGVC